MKTDEIKRCRRCGIALDPMPHIGAEFCRKCFAPKPLYMKLTLLKDNRSGLNDCK